MNFDFLLGVFCGVGLIASVVFVIEFYQQYRERKRSKMGGL